MKKIYFAQKDGEKILNRNLSIITLGPEGTSSENTAIDLNKSTHGGGVKLYDTYELATDCVERGDGLLLVANAYQHINQFYIHSKLRPFAAFFYETPKYALAYKHDFVEPINTKIIIASHRAPAHLAKHYYEESRFDVHFVQSTSVAARMVRTGEVDVCITNQIAANLENLHFHPQQFAINMLWTLFCPSEAL